MSNKALTYAEEQLGVHKIWHQTQELLESLDNAFVDLDKAQDDKRKLTERYSDREVELIGEMRSVHVSYSDTRFKSEFKTWERQDSQLRVIRSELNTTLSFLQGVDIDIDMMKNRIKANCARMEQLGGYLHFLAAVKAEKTQADNTNRETRLT